MSKTLDIQIDLPDETSDESIQLAGAKAREAAILTLQQRGELSIREAAAELGLTYEGYLDLLNKQGLPATNADSDPAVLDAIRQALLERGMPPR